MHVHHFSVFRDVSNDNQKKKKKSKKKKKKKTYFSCSNFVKLVTNRVIGEKKKIEIFKCNKKYTSSVTYHDTVFSTESERSRFDFHFKTFKVKENLTEENRFRSTAAF